MCQCAWYHGVLPGIDDDEVALACSPNTLAINLLPLQLSSRCVFARLLGPVHHECSQLVSELIQLSCCICCAMLSPRLLIPGRTRAEALLHGSQDQVLGLLNTLSGADNLDGVLVGVVARNVDLTTALLADGVDLAAALANDVAVGLGVGKDQVASVGVLAGLLNSGGDGSLGLLDVLGRTAQDPRDLAVLAGAGIHNLP